MTRPRSSHLLEPALLSHGLNTARVGRCILVLPEVANTNAYALDTLAASEGESADGAVVFAEHQTAGRGRLGRTWHCPRGAGLTFTLLLWEHLPGGSPATAVMAAAVAVARGIAQSTDVEAAIRWPNDIYVRDRKLAGILIETRRLEAAAQATAIGIGINCLQHTAHFPPEIRRRATSLELESKQAIDRIAVARAVLQALDAYLAEPDRIHSDALAADWREHSADIGTRVTLDSKGETFTGRVLDVNPRTGLLLQLDTGARREFDPTTTTRLQEGV